MAEGSLEAPIRHPINWQNEDFYNEDKLHEEMERVFDICHGCRRCFNLCSSFPTLFDLIDESETGELDSVDKKDYKKVVDGCTLCDMCFLTKCPYVPPHEFNLDFPHLMLRFRAVEARKGARKFSERQLTKTDRNGKMGTCCSSITNWASDKDNKLTRPLLQGVADVHRDAALPKYASKTLSQQAAADQLTVNKNAPAFGEKVAIYATCYGEYNTPEVGMALRRILAHNGVESEVVYPECCGMPQLEQGELGEVAAKAARIAAALNPYIEKGYQIVTSVPSCALMIKQEWALISPDNQAIKTLAAHTSDVSEYLIGLKKRKGLADGLKAIDAPVAVHIACHARAQNLGRKGEELLRLIPDIDLTVVERCSGHGGSWGIMKDNFEIGLKQGKPVYKQMAAGGKTQIIASECPLAGLHIAQGIEENPVKGENGEAAPAPELLAHPLLVLERAWGLSAP